MKVNLARAALLVVTLPLVGLGAWILWTHPGGFGWGESTLYAGPGAALVIGLLAFVASFSPFDRPQSTKRWVVPIVGLLIGSAFSGMLVFSATFLWLAIPLLVAALVAFYAARAIGAGPPDLDLPTKAFDDDEIELPNRNALSPGLKLALAAGVLAGCALNLSWAPSGGARPGDLEAGVAAIVSRPARKRVAKRIQRHARSVEVTGRDLRLLISLERPRAQLKLRDQNMILEPCLVIEEGSVDGFPVLPLNRIALEPTGPAMVDLAESGSRAWVRVSYPQGRARYADLAKTAPFLGRRAGAASISATIEFEVDLTRGRVIVDARTRLDDHAPVSRGSLTWLRLLNAPQRSVRVGLGPGIDFTPSKKGEPLRFFSTEGSRTRLLQAARGNVGPFEPKEVGPFHDWLVLSSEHTQTLIFAPDWRAQASLAHSRSAGHGLRENSLRLWREGGGLNLLMDVASSRVGEGPLLAELPPGLYRNRLVIVPLRREDPAKEADRWRAHFELAARVGARVESPPRPAREDVGDEERAPPESGPTGIDLTPR